MRASAVKPAAVEWLWHPYFPKGKISVNAGQMGQAKSLFMVWLAGEVSNGRLGDDPASVVFYSAEDDAADTIRPRLEAVGADLDRIWIETSSMLSRDHLVQLCDELGDVALVGVDPAQAYAPAGVNTWKGSDVRQWLDPFRILAAERRLALVLVQHLNRRADAADPLARIADSQGIPQLARSVCLWGADPTDPEGDQGLNKVLTRAKGNLSRSSASASFSIVERTNIDGLRAPALVRGADTRITAEEVVADHEARSAAEEAAEWIKHLLADGPMDAKKVMRRASEDGINERTLKRAKSKAGAISEPNRDENKISGWTWRLIKKEVPLDLLGTLDPLDKGAKGDNSDNSDNGYMPVELTV